jgi:ABC-type nickel/cobalt efflux system permease component RcnA
MNDYKNKESINIACGGCGFSGLLTIAFIILKLCGVIDWSWWLVFLPLIISIGLPITIILFILLGCFIWGLCINAKSQRTLKKRHKKFKQQPAKDIDEKNENQNKNE